MSNLRSIGLAIVMYTNDNKNMILPTFACNGDLNDYWPFILVNAKYLPNPHIVDQGVGSAGLAKNSVLVCPSAPLEITQFADGFRRFKSNWLMSNTEGVGNGAGGACILYVGYGANGTFNSPANKVQPMQSRPFTNAATTSIHNPIHKITEFRVSSKSVLLFDGVDFNIQLNNQRIYGTRHGQTDATKPLRSGITNILFLDGHVEGVLRRDLPFAAINGSGNGTPINGSTSQMLSKLYVWNVNQLND